MRNRKRWISALIMTCFFSMTALADVTVTMYSTTPDSTNPKNPKNKKAEKLDKNKKEIGTITFKSTLYGLMMVPDLHGLQPGMHGMHLHVTPSCKHKAQSAGGHFDPSNTGKHLGPYNAEGHLGDLPALYVDQYGVATHQILAPRLHENNLYGHAIVIHAGDDNYSDLPAPLGGGGDRVACGVVKNSVEQTQ